MAKLSTDQLIDGFKELSLIELTEFVKKFEEVFEVTAAAPVAAAAAPAAAGGDAGDVEEKTSFDVVLEAAGEKKSRSSRRCALSPASVSVKQRHSWMVLPVLLSRVQTRRPPKRRKQFSKRPAQPSPSSSNSFHVAVALTLVGATLH